MTLGEENCDEEEALDYPGVYTGSYSAFPISVEVRVNIQNHQITGIDLVKHNNGQGAPAEIITEKVTAANSIWPGEAECHERP